MPDSLAGMTDTAAPHSETTRILYFDIENSPALGWTWGKYDQNVLGFEQQPYMLAASWMWETVAPDGTSKVGKPQVKALCDFDGYDPDAADDSALVGFCLELLDSADVVIGHNLDAFDIRKVNGYALRCRPELGPPSPYLTVDTLKVARRFFSFPSNRLGDLCELLELPAKETPGGFGLWLRCMAGDAKAWRTMKSYARQDAAILRPLYLRLRPWMSNHPVLVVDPDEFRCPTCASADVHRRGVKRTKAGGRFQQWHCRACGSYSRTRVSDGVRPKLV